MPQYWTAVAKYVTGKTALECRLKTEEKYRTPKLAKKSKPLTEKEIDITAGLAKGPNARRKQMRQLMKQVNAGHEDDIFESTPFKGTQESISIEIEDEILPFDSTATANGSTSTTTNQVFVDPNQESPLILKSVNRDALDGYINVLKKKRPMITVPSKSSIQDEPVARKRTMLQTLQNQLSKKNSKVDQQEEEEEATYENDKTPYYWSDAE
eukprot:GILK01004096.1.p2 GENE.GILK01004096.1~~GILK01004096.1.p2  ORF type:complete len:211 (-),score=65.37 GILK01004096.1:200-832(-)